MREKKKADKKGTKGQRKKVSAVRKTSAQVKRDDAFSWEVAERILARLASGESLVAICESEGFPCRQTVSNWMVRGIRKNDSELRTFAEAFVLACNIRSTLLEDEFIEMLRKLRDAKAEDLTAGDAVKFKLWFDNSKWFMIRWRRRDVKFEGLEDVIKKFNPAPAGGGSNETGTVSNPDVHERLLSLRKAAEAEKENE